MRFINPRDKTIDDRVLFFCKKTQAQFYFFIEEVIEGVFRVFVLKK